MSSDAVWLLDDDAVVLSVGVGGRVTLREVDPDDVPENESERSTELDDVFVRDNESLGETVAVTPIVFDSVIDGSTLVLGEAVPDDDCCAVCVELEEGEEVQTGESLPLVDDDLLVVGDADVEAERVHVTLGVADEE